MEKFVEMRSQQIEHFLKQPMANRWMSYEWNCSDVDEMFFDQSNDFNVIFSRSFPTLKTRHLLKAEWRRIRKLFRFNRRLSSNYFYKTRCKLEKFRRKVKLCPDWHQVQLESYVVQTATEKLIGSDKCIFGSDLNLMNSAESSLMDLQTTVANKFHQISPTVRLNNILFKFLKLLIETNKNLAVKKSLLNGLKKLTANLEEECAGKTSNQSAIKIIVDLRDINSNIIGNFDQLWNFDLFKECILLNSTIPLAGIYIQKKYEQVIIKQHLIHKTDTFIPKNNLLIFVNVLLSLAFLITNNNINIPRRFFLNTLTEKTDQLKSTIDDANFNHFTEQCLPQILSMYSMVQLQANDE